MAGYYVGGGIFYPTWTPIVASPTVPVPAPFVGPTPRPATDQNYQFWTQPSVYDWWSVQQQTARPFILPPAPAVATATPRSRVQDWGYWDTTWSQQSTIHARVPVAATTTAYVAPTTRQYDFWSDALRFDQRSTAHAIPTQPSLRAIVGQWQWQQPEIQQPRPSLAVLASIPVYVPPRGRANPADSIWETYTVQRPRITIVPTTPLPQGSSGQWQWQTEWYIQQSPLHAAPIPSPAVSPIFGPRIGQWQWSTEWYFQQPRTQAIGPIPGPLSRPSIRQWDWQVEWVWQQQRALARFIAPPPAASPYSSPNRQQFNDLFTLDWWPQPHVLANPITVVPPTPIIALAQGGYYRDEKLEQPYGDDEMVRALQRLQTRLRDEDDMFDLGVL